MSILSNGSSRVSRILGTDGLPLNQGPPGQALPHVYTFAALINQANKTYSWRWDEAYKHSRENALVMRRDCYLMGLLRERQYPTEQMSWHIEPEDKLDEGQMKVAERISAIIKSTPRIKRMLRSMLEAIWYGRSAVQMTWDWTMVNGEPAYSVVNHQMVNGDKIQFGWDGIPRILVYSGAAAELRKQGANVIVTDRNTALVLDTPFWRERFAIHQHDCIDADFFEADMAGGMAGVGIRHWVYWYNWMKLEVQSWLLDFMERCGLGLTLYYYDPSNPASEAMARKAATEDGRNTVIVWPAAPGDSNVNSSRVERIETSTAGSDVINKMVEYFDSHLQRFIVGQTLSSSTEGSGLGGTGVAQIHADTKYRIIKDDAENLSDSLSEDVVRLVHKYNDLASFEKFKLRWVFDVDVPDPEAKLAAAQILYSMGIPIKTDEVRGIAGFSKPTDDDEVTIDPMHLAIEEGTANPDGSMPEENPPAKKKEKSAAA